MIKRLEKRIEQGLNKKAAPALFSFDGFLFLCSMLYAMVVKCRLFLFQKKILKSEKLPCLVVSVGNMVVGGAGKTPMAMYLAELFQKMGKTPAVVSRGYKGSFSGTALVVSDGRQVFCTAQVCGDEPYMMARRGSFAVVVGKNRTAAGRLAIDTLGCDVIILDDGLQHLKLERDLNLLLVDWEQPLGNSRLLPSGRLREIPEMVFPRTHAVVATRCPENLKALTGKKENTKKKAIRRLVTNKAPVFFSCHVPCLVKTVQVNGSQVSQIKDISSLKDKNALLFSGLARNLPFYRSIEQLGVNIVSHLEFKDHYRYKSADIEHINEQARLKKADLIITTEKDWAKQIAAYEWQTDVVIMGVNIGFHDPSAFHNFLKQELNIT